MATAQRINPHRNDALTTDSIRPGVYFATWEVDNARPAQYYTAVSTPYQDDEGYMRIQVTDHAGQMVELSTGDIGLTACPDGNWRAIAIAIDPESAG